MKHTLYKNCPQVQFVNNLCAICVNLQNNLMSCFGLIDKKIVSETITATATGLPPRPQPPKATIYKKKFITLKKKLIQHYNITTL